MSTNVVQFSDNWRPYDRLLAVVVAPIIAPGVLLQWNRSNQTCQLLGTHRIVVPDTLTERARRRH
jgi:hypothetical protein